VRNVRVIFIKSWIIEFAWHWKKKADCELCMINLSTMKNGIREKIESSIGHITIHVFLLFNFFNIFMLYLISPCLIKKPNDEYVFLIVHNSTYIHLESQFWDFFFQLVVTRREPGETEKKKKKSIVCMYVFIFWDVVTDAQLECS